jgi:hypothetical protein
MSCVASVLIPPFPSVSRTGAVITLFEDENLWMICPGVVPWWTWASDPKRSLPAVLLAVADVQERNTELPESEQGCRCIQEVDGVP